MKIELIEVDELKPNRYPLYFNIDGTTHDKPSHIPAIVQVRKDDDVSTDTKPGWYFCDEVAQLNGPFNTFKKAVTAFKKYEP